MRSQVDNVMKVLAEAEERARHIQIPLDSQFMRLIALVESLPANREGADKSWVWEADRAFKDHYRRARRI